MHPRIKNERLERLKTQSSLKRDILPPIDKQLARGQTIAGPRKISQAATTKIIKQRFFRLAEKRTKIIETTCKVTLKQTEIVQWTTKQSLWSDQQIRRWTADGPRSKKYYTIKWLKSWHDWTASTIGGKSQSRGARRKEQIRAKKEISKHAKRTTSWRDQQVRKRATKNEYLEFKDELKND